jgi:hypothetical protein
VRAKLLSHHNIIELLPNFPWLDMPSTSPDRKIGKGQEETNAIDQGPAEGSLPFNINLE